MINYSKKLGKQRCRSCSGVAKYASLAIFAAMTFFMSAISTKAAPIIDTFENTSMLSAASGSTIFDISTGNLIATPAETSPGTWGAFGGQAIFVWSMDGGKYSGFSVAESDQQNVLQLTGVQNVTPVGKTDAFLYGYIYLFTGSVLATPQFDVNPVDGNWSLNIYDLALNALGTIPDGLKWSVEFYSASGGQEGVGYEFASMSAIPEPSAVFMVLAAGAFLAICLVRKNILLKA